ncbi:hypothetical protein LTS18_000972, partial [Coniosporium uncinatum]
MPEDIELRGKYAKISKPDEEDAAPLRPSLEAAYRSESDDDDIFSEHSDIDEFDALNYDAGTLKRKKTQRTGQKGIVQKEPNFLSQQKKKSWIRRICVPT